MPKKGGLKDWCFVEASREEGNVSVHVSWVARDLSSVKFDRTTQDKRVVTMTDGRDLNKTFFAMVNKYFKKCEGLLNLISLSLLCDVNQFLKESAGILTAWSN